MPSSWPPTWASVARRRRRSRPAPKSIFDSENVPPGGRDPHTNSRPPERACHISSRNRKPTCSRTVSTRSMGRHKSCRRRIRGLSQGRTARRSGRSGDGESRAQSHDQQSHARQRYEAHRQFQGRQSCEQHHPHRQSHEQSRLPRTRHGRNHRRFISMRLLRKSPRARTPLSFLIKPDGTSRRPSRSRAISR